MAPVTGSKWERQLGGATREQRRMYETFTDRAERQQRERRQLAERMGPQRRDRRMLSFHRPGR